MSLSRGVTAFQMPFATNIDDTIQSAADILRQNNLAQPGTPIVIVSDMLSDHFTANSILLYHA
jgi:pyruvate kinase